VLKLLYIYSTIEHFLPVGYLNCGNCKVECLTASYIFLVNLPLVVLSMLSRLCYYFICYYFIALFYVYFACNFQWKVFVNPQSIWYVYCI